MSDYYRQGDAAADGCGIVGIVALIALVGVIILAVIA